MKRSLLLVLIICIFVLSGCSVKQDKKAIEFKEEYESMNGIVNSKGKEHRSVFIDLHNSFEKVDASDIVEMIENEETFYVYFGDKLCPWCRSVIEKAVEISNKNKIEKIYYVAIWDDDGNEVLRDKYALEEGQLNKISDGTEEYYKLLEYFDDVLSEYNLTDDEGNKVEVGEKRIFAPNFIYVKDGKAVRLTEGISELQKDSREELTSEILKDEKKLFEAFFK